ncbi:MAG: hypothetical protein GY856_07955 [bacterium]|nr:hypothetical protein [bacterium]
MGKSALTQTRGPFRADQIRSGDPYELSNGHPILCLPSCGRESRATLLGASILDSDPGVESVGIDTGCSPEPGTLRAPDIAVGNVPDEPGWMHHGPLLAVEYADVGQDEEDLGTKIGELFGAGTRIVWVVRLTGPRRIEIYEPEKPMRLAHQGDELLPPSTGPRRRRRFPRRRRRLQRPGGPEALAPPGRHRGLGAGEPQILLAVRCNGII